MLDDLLQLPAQQTSARHNQCYVSNQGTCWPTSCCRFG